MSAAQFRVWNDPAVDRDASDRLIIRSVWDYTLQLDAFLERCDCATERSRFADIRQTARASEMTHTRYTLARIGITEPPAACVPKPFFADTLPRNGAKEIRTPDLLGAIQALYQLSYSPKATKV
jgi:hypothetical protein